MYPVIDIYTTEESKSQFGDVHGVCGMMSFVAKQTIELLSPPHLNHIVFLFIHVFALYIIGFGLVLW